MRTYELKNNILYTYLFYIITLLSWQYRIILGNRNGYKNSSNFPMPPKRVIFVGLYTVRLRAKMRWVSGFTKHISEIEASVCLSVAEHVSI